MSNIANGSHDERSPSKTTTTTTMRDDESGGETANGKRQFTTTGGNATTGAADARTMASTDGSNGGAPSRSESTYAFDTFGEGDAPDVERVTEGIELERRARGDALEREASVRGKGKKRGGEASSAVILPRLLDCSGMLQDACAAIVDDSFNRCFQESDEAPWNFNFYLLPLWWLGWVVRHFVLFPIRLTFLLTASVLFAVSFMFVHYCMPRKWGLERKCVELYSAAFVVSWTGVIKYHGPRPTKRGHRGGVVYVSNHTSMIDYLVMSQVSPFAVIQQKHKGWVGLLQRTAMDAIDCIQFNRTDIKDRHTVTARLKQHVADKSRLPLLIFPEGTCVNNKYCVMFKRGAFDLGVDVVPVAIKYNNIFVDAFWNSRRQSFSRHLCKLMSSWAVVADVWYMEPQRKRDDETSIEFAERVRMMICKRAGIKAVPWDGMLKYYRPSPRECESRRKAFAEGLMRGFA
jgi:glycerol-3-phosphate O-acyltransferase 3/4